MKKSVCWVFSGAFLLASCAETTPPDPLGSSSAQEVKPQEDGRELAVEHGTVLLEGFSLHLPHKVRAASSRSAEGGRRIRAVDVEYFDFPEHEFTAKLYSRLRSAGYEVRQRAPQLEGEGARAYITGPSGGRMVAIVNGNPRAKLSDERSRGTAYFQWDEFELVAGSGGGE